MKRPRGHGNSQAAFHRSSNVTASTVSLSDNPCNVIIGRHIRQHPVSGEGFQRVGVCCL